MVGALDTIAIPRWTMCGNKIISICKLNLYDLDLPYFQALPLFTNVKCVSGRELRVGQI